VTHAVDAFFMSASQLAVDRGSIAMNAAARSLGKKARRGCESCEHLNPQSKTGPPIKLAALFRLLGSVSIAQIKSRRNTQSRRKSTGSIGKPSSGMWIY
jgi:hypothetical protein